MKVYLAAPYGARDFARTLADDLRSNGCEITSTWLSESHEITPGTERAATDLTDEVVRAHVLNDFKDIREANLFILLTAAVCGTEGGGGRHVETGYAMAQYTPVVVVGEPENVFHRMGEDVAICPTWGEAVDHVRSLMGLAQILRDFDCCIPGAVSHHHSDVAS